MDPVEQSRINNQLNQLAITLKAFYDRAFISQEMGLVGLPFQRQWWAEFVYRRFQS